MADQNSRLEYLVWPGSPLLKTYDIDKQIDWFECYIDRWIFEPARSLLATNNTDFDLAVLAILNSIPEMLAQLQGFGKEFPAERYRRGIEYIFPDIDDNVFEDNELIEELLYGILRCGLAHFASVGEKILITRNAKNLSFTVLDRVDLRHMPGWFYRPPVPLVAVNVPEWYEQIEKRIGDYITDLRNSTKTADRSKFSERITQGDTPASGTPSDCVCGAKSFCVVCENVKLPGTHRNPGP